MDGLHREHVGDTMDEVWSCFQDNSLDQSSIVLLLLFMVTLVY